MIRLTNEKIREITVGCVKIEEDEGILRFYKYTEEQMSGFGPWRKISPCTCTTGVKFDFYTNSKKIAISVASAGKYEIWIDGVLRHALVAHEPEGEGNILVGERFEVELTDVFGKEKDELRVTVYLPSHYVGLINYLELDEGAYVRRYEYKRKFLIIGDSLTQGWQSEYDSLSYANRICRVFDAEAIIQGRGGSCYVPATMTKLENFDPDVVIVAYGTNDYGRIKTYEEYRKNVRDYHDRVKECYGEKKIFIISPIWRLPNPNASLDFCECREIIRDEAEKHGFIHVDGATLVPPIEKGFFTDGLHLTDLGFSIFSENLIAEMMKHI